MWVISMTKKYNSIMLWVVLFGVIVFCFLLLYEKTEFRMNKVNYTDVYSENGIWDLRDIDFDTTVIKLEGNVEHIPNAILTPKEFQENEDKIEIGQPKDVNEGRTVRITLLMPENKSYHVYTIGDYARKVYLNGEERGSTGVPSADADTFEPAYGAIFGDVLASGNEIEIVMQGGNFVHVATNGYTNVYIGNTKLVQWFMGYENSMEFSIIAILFFITILHLIFALMFGNYPLHLAFCATCIIWAIRLGLVGSKILYEIMPTMPWEVAFKAEYITIPIGSILIIECIYMQQKEAFNKMVLRIFEGVLALFAVVFLFVNTYTMSGLLIPLQATYILTLLYLAISGGVWRFKKYRAKEKVGITQKISYISVFIIAYAGISDALYFNEIFLFGVDVPLAEISILIFGIFETVAIFHLTVQKMKQAQFAEKEALATAKNLENLNKMKTEFLQNMSHEMKTPLTVIGTGTDYAKRQIKKPNIDTDATNETLTTIKTQTERLSRMVSGMVDMVALTTGEHRKKINFSELLNSSVSSFGLIAEEQNNHLNLIIEENLPFVFVDYDSFMRVMTNLLSNAMDSTENGSITIKATSDKQFINVSVTDTGGGIPSELLNKVTQRGVSGKNSTGLGLAICQTIIHAHGGILNLQSMEQKGTTVAFTVPVYGGQEEGHRI